MAKLYGEIASSALMSFDKSFARLNGQPLDSSEVYYSKAAAEAYAATAGAYIGQKIVVIENNVVTHYSIEDAAGTLKELGAKPIGDEKSIEVSSGIIGMHNFGKAFYKYIPEVKDEETGEVTKEASYEKVEVSESNPWKAGLEPKVVTEDSKLVIGWFEPNPTTIEGVNDQVTAVQGTVANLESAVGTPGDDNSEATGLYKEIDDVQVELETVTEDVQELVDSVGSSSDSLTESTQTLWANVNNINNVIQTIEGDYLTSTDKEELQNAIDAIEVPVVGVAADDKVLALGADKLISATVSMSYDSENKAIKLYGKENVELGSVDATPFIKDGMLSDVEYNADNNTLTFTWNTDSGDKSDTVVLSDIIEPYTAGDGLELNGNVFKVKLAEGSESYLTVTADGIKLSGIADAIATAKGEAIADAEGKIATAKQEAIADAATAAEALYATKTALSGLETALDGRLDALEAYDHSTYATKQELADHNTAAEAKYATKDELAPVSQTATNAANKVETLEDKIDEITSVGGQPNVIEYIKVNGTILEVEKDGEGNSTKTVNVSVPTKFTDITDDSGFNTRITAAQTQADKGVTDAAAAQTTANEAKAAAESNATAIGSINTTIAGHTTTIGQHTEKITALENADVAHTAEYNSLKGIVEGHTSTIATLASQSSLDAVSAKTSANETAIKTINETTIPAINTEIGKKANSADVYTKSEVGTIAEGKTLVQMISDAQTAATYNDTEIRGLISSEADRAKAAEKVNADAIVELTSKIGDVANIMNFRGVVTVADGESIPTDGYANGDVIIVGNQEYVFDGADWKPFGDASVNAALITALDIRVTANEQDIAEMANAETGVLATAKKYTDTQIAAIPAATAEALGLVKVDNVTIKADAGVIAVKEISTDLLVNGSTALILNGGGASANR